MLGTPTHLLLTTAEEMSKLIRNIINAPNNVPRPIEQEKCDKLWKDLTASDQNLRVYTREHTTQESYASLLNYWMRYFVFRITDLVETGAHLYESDTPGFTVKEVYNNVPRFKAVIDDELSCATLVKKESDAFDLYFGAHDKNEKVAVILAELQHVFKNEELPSRKKIEIVGQVIKLPAVSVLMQTASWESQPAYFFKKLFTGHWRQLQAGLVSPVEIYQNLLKMVKSIDADTQTQNNVEAVNTQKNQQAQLTEPLFISTMPDLTAVPESPIGSPAESDISAMIRGVQEGKLESIISLQDILQSAVVALISELNVYAKLSCNQVEQVFAQKMIADLLPVKELIAKDMMQLSNAVVEETGRKNLNKTDAEYRESTMQFIDVLKIKQAEAGKNLNNINIGLPTKPLLHNQNAKALAKLSEIIPEAIVDNCRDFSKQ